MSFFKCLALSAIAAVTSGLQMNQDEIEVINGLQRLGQLSALDWAKVTFEVNALAQQETPEDPEDDPSGPDNVKPDVTGRDRALERADPKGQAKGLYKMAQAHSSVDSDVDNSVSSLQLAQAHWTERV